ncbi:MAG: hydrogenase maturation protein HypF, partial [Coriobacteriales bacterium]
SGTSRELIALRFHVAFANAIVEVCTQMAREHDIDTVALSGGVFMNLYLLTHVRASLEEAGLQVLVGKELPANDGCISYGEAVVALARLQGAETE